MKYARTEDGKIFELEKDLGGREVSKTIAICDFGGNLIDVERQSAILKQADAIEDLCDEFAMDNRVIVGCSAEGMSNFEVAKYFAKIGRNVFGAVWTEKGLIFAAKMNEKGEMELL